MPISRLTLCDVLENEFVSVGLEKDVDENDQDYLKQLSDAEASFRGRHDRSYFELKDLHRQAQEEFDRQSAEGEPAPATRREYEDSEKQRLDRLMKILGTRERAALCLSGGGIRSATFSLGVMQGLAHRLLLQRFDYLSTVSGGGYIGSWLSAWLAYENADRGGPSPISKVEQALSDSPKKKVDGEIPKVEHLRSYSNYLSPHTGFLSTDAWTLAATVIRNMLLNWLILVPALGVALLVPRLSLAIVRSMGQEPDWLLFALLWFGFALAALAVSNIGRYLPSIGGQKCTPGKYAGYVLTPLVVSAILLTTFWARWYGAGRSASLAWYLALGASIHLVGWVAIDVVPAIRKTYRDTNKLGEAFGKGVTHLAAHWATGFAIVTGLLGGWIAYLLTDNGILDPKANPELSTCLAFPAVMLIYFLVSVLFIGFASKQTDDEDREWWARSGAWILIVAFGWLALSILVIYGPMLVGKIAAMIGAGGFGVGYLGSVAGQSSKTGAAKDQKDQPKAGGILSSTWILTLAEKFAPAIFLVCLLLTIAKASELLLRLKLIPLAKIALAGYEWLDTDIAAVVALLILFAAIAWVMSHYVNVNTFSLHAMYRSRLIRAYLGASNPDRAPNPFTGFDPADNLRMCKLSPGKPFHIVNIALNLVRGKRLAWQQRKAESFTVSRLHSGSARVGYQSTRRYAGTEGITLGTAMGISGAAASPNMGYHSSPLMTFLMTFFNARLGWWLANPGIPGRKMWREPGPKSALKSLLGEAFGQTDDENEYVYLSDGGHFENLGLYEMVLRRCKIIVVVDGGADPTYEFEDLGNAIRKIRVDFGISIHLDKPIRMTAGLSQANVHCATAEISYACVDPGATPGTLIYIKPVLDDMQSIDVDHYYASHKQFPQEPTADQFFDEAQFESYRRLGLESIDRIFATQGRNPVLLTNFHAQAALHRGAGGKAVGIGC